MEEQNIRWAIIDSTHQETMAINFENATKSELLTTQVSQHAIEKVIEDENIDAIYFPEISNKETDIIIKAIKAKKHVVCNDTHNLSEHHLLRIYHHSQLYDVVFIDVNTFSYNDEHFEQVKQIIQDGTIGSLKLIKSSIAEPIDNLINDNLDHYEDILQRLGRISIDTISHLLNNKPIHVSSADAVVNNPISTLCTLIDFPNHIQAMISCSLEIDKHHYYKLIGTKGSITIAIKDSTDQLKITVRTSHNNKVITLLNNNKPNIDELSEAITSNETIGSGETNISSARAMQAVIQLSKQKHGIHLTKPAIHNDGWGAECGIVAMLRK